MITNYNSYIITILNRTKIKEIKKKKGKTMKKKQQTKITIFTIRLQAHVMFFLNVLIRYNLHKQLNSSLKQKQSEYSLIEI